MEHLSLMIADSNDDFRFAIEQALRDSYQVYSCSDGLQALKAAEQLKPDILILDLMLTGLDGITLLQELQAKNLRPMVMVITRLNNSYVADWVDAFGIEYFMLKPCAPNAAARRVADLSKRLKPQIQEQIAPGTYASEQLNRLSFSPRHLGTAYLKDAVELMYQDPGISITKELYPAIGIKNDTSAVLVERSIRSAINAAWTQGCKEIWAEFFPPNAEGISTRPSNGFFVARLVEDLQHKCKNSSG